MEKTSAASAMRSPVNVPLARDANGLAIPIPEDAAGWRVRRQTGGRPRLVLDANKQPMMFPLHYTANDVEDILPPGAYRLDVVSVDGELLDVSVAISVGAPRNAVRIETNDDEDDGDGDDEEEDDRDEDDAEVAVPTTLPAQTSDVRLLLEASIRTTQMTFRHNERTLALGLRTTDTLREALQALAESQAQWIGIASARPGFFRYAKVPPQVEPPRSPRLPPAPPDSGGGDGEEGEGEEDDDEDEGEYEDEDEDEYDAPRRSPPAARATPPPSFLSSLLERFEPQIMALVPVVATKVMSWASAPSDPNAPKFELADMLDWRRPARRKAEHEAAKAEAALREAEEAAARAAQASSAWKPVPTDVPLLSLLPPELIMKLMEVRSGLTPTEQIAVMSIIEEIPREHLIYVLAPELVRMSVDEVIAVMKDQAAKLFEDNERRKRERAAAAPPVSTTTPAPPPPVAGTAATESPRSGAAGAVPPVAVPPTAADGAAPAVALALVKTADEE